MTLHQQLRFFFKKGQNNLIKILSLGVGLAMGLILVGKVYFEQSYDDFYPDAERIYIIQCNFSQQKQEMETYSQVSGAVAPGMKAEIPEVEQATRYTYFAEGTFYTEDRKKYSSEGFILADSCLFDLFPRPMLIGNAKEVLSRPMHVLVSASIAEKMGGVHTVVGKTIELDERPGRVMTIGGVFEDIPENSHMNDYDVIVSLPSISQFMWDGSQGWLGNDRYLGYVKLARGVSPESLAPAIRRMQEKNQPMERLKEEGVELTYSLLPLREIHSGTPEAKRMTRLISLLAFAILFTAVMNYILVVISSLVRRSKEMAVYKCYGASEKNIYGKMFSETFVHLLLSLLLSALLIYAFRGAVTDLLDTSPEALFSLKACLIMTGVCLLVFIISGCVPGYLFSRIPISSAFRNYNETRRSWKLWLLFIQFMAAGFLFTLVMIIARQYNHMVNDSPGYAYENLSYCSLSGVKAESRKKVVDEISRMPEVAAVSTCSELFLGHPSGNNISLPGDDRELFNIADLYSVGNGYLDVMEIPIVEGRGFLEDVESSNEVMVSRRFLEKMKLFADWSDGPIGKNIFVTEHSQSFTQPFTICGVYEDVRLGAIGREDERPSVMFYRNNPSGILLVKYHRQTAEADKKVSERLEGLLPEKDVVLYPYSAELRALYSDSRKFRDAVLIGSLIALIISLIGLIGYTNDEMNRRRKEIAVRKVNGATIGDVLFLFLKDIARIALPAALLAGGIAAFVGARWLEQFSKKMTLSPLLFVACGIIMLVIILAVVAFNCYRAATANPAKSIKAE